jgi:hypothetical protein
MTLIDAIKDRAKRVAARHAGPLLLPLEIARQRDFKVLGALRTLERPIVLGGCGRSGTTLLLSVLSCHPKLFALGDETATLCPHAYERVDEAPDTSYALRTDLLLRYVMREGVPPGAERICEKTPRNVHFFPKVLDAWGERARLIHLVRDGRDVVTSRHPGKPGSWVNPERWIADVHAGLRLEGHPQMLTVRYEDFTANYEQTVRRICEFVGIDFVPEFLKYPDSARLKGNVEQLAWFGGRRPVAAPSNSKRWQAPEHAPLIERLMRDPRAGRLLERYGYL